MHYAIFENVALIGGPGLAVKVALIGGSGLKTAPIGESGLDVYLLFIYLLIAKPIKGTTLMYKNHISD